MFSIRVGGGEVRWLSSSPRNWQGAFALLSLCCAISTRYAPSPTTPRHAMRCENILATLCGVTSAVTIFHTRVDSWCVRHLLSSTSSPPSSTLSQAGAGGRGVGAGMGVGHCLPHSHHIPKSDYPIGIACQLATRSLEVAAAASKQQQQQHQEHQSVCT